MQDSSAQDDVTYAIDPLGCSEYRWATSELEFPTSDSLHMRHMACVKRAACSSCGRVWSRSNHALPASSAPSASEPPAEPPMRVPRVIIFSA